MPLFSKKSKKKVAVEQFADTAQDSDEEVETKQRGKDIEQEFADLASSPGGLTTTEAQVRFPSAWPCSILVDTWSRSTPRLLVYFLFSIANAFV